MEQARCDGLYTTIATETKGGYFAEQQAVTNRKGDKIIFSSNWGGDEISDFLITIPSPITQG
jgi:hypothetical protein